MFRDLLKRLCRRRLGLTVAGDVGTAAEGLALCRRHQPDFVMLDLNLPDRNGIEIVDELLAANPRGRILAVSCENDDLTLWRVLNSGVHGFVDKNHASLEDLAQAISEVADGGVHLPACIQAARQRLRLDPRAFTRILTEHERKVLPLLGCGLTNEDAGKRLQVSPRTVRLHRWQIMAKLDLHSIKELIRYAVSKGFAKLKDFRG